MTRLPPKKQAETPSVHDSVDYENDSYESRTGVASEYSEDVSLAEAEARGDKLAKEVADAAVEADDAA